MGDTRPDQPETLGDPLKWPYSRRWCKTCQVETVHEDWGDHFDDHICCLEHGIGAKAVAKGESKIPDG